MEELVHLVVQLTAAQPVHGDGLQGRRRREKQ